MSDDDMVSPDAGNRPGLPAIAYRAGTHGSFLRRMLARLPAESLTDGARPLARLSTRAPDDGAIALLDAWATVADVLTFYQERIANEGFLRTATERRSVLELARAIGYELRPGVAASTHLAFTVDDAPGSPTTAFVPKGTKVQSMPAHGGQPQTFEPSGDFTALTAWNVLRPRLTQPQVLDLDASTILLQGQPADVTPGGVLAIVQADSHGLLAQARARQIASVTYDPARRVTRVVLTGPTVPPADFRYRLEPSKLAAPTSGRLPLDDATAEAVLSAAWREQDLASLLQLRGWDPDVLTAYAARRRSILSMAGVGMTTTDVELEISTTADGLYDPMATGIVSGTLRGPIVGNPVLAVTGRLVAEYRDPSDLPTRSTGTFSGVLRFMGAGIANLEVDVSGPGLDLTELQMQLSVQVSATNELTGILSGRGGGLRPSRPVGRAEPGVYAFHTRAAPFGHNAPAFSAPPPKPATTPDWDDPGYQSVMHNSTHNTWGDGTHLYADRALPEVLVGSWVALHDGGHLLAYRVSELRDRTLAEFGLIGRATGIVFRGDRAGTDVYDDLISIGRRTATIHAGSQSLDLAGVPLDAPFGKGTEEARQLTLDTMVLGLLPGQPVAVWGERAGLPAVTATEVATLDAVIHHDGYTTLFFAHDLDHTYARATAILTANLVPATHGETVRQVLGSGDAGRANQRFTLNKPPLTYVAAASSSGAASALEVRVGGVRWEEAPALFGLDGHAQRYVVRADDDGRATVEFGDGQEGARLPTGSENVSAVYRSGLGLAGHVPAGSLILLQTRPPGIRSVVNPLPATGAAEPEDLEGARRNAPRTVLTLDRIVSAQDFEDFARGFAGIGKARAIALQGAEVRFVHLTVAGADGGVVDPQSALYLALVDAIRRSADPAQPFMVDRHLPRLFNVSAKVLVDPRYEVDPVLALVGNAVRQAFSFGPRSFGQPVTAAAVVTVIQGVTGVVATDLDQLYRVDEPGGPRSDTPAPVLRARSARIVDDEVRTSELLLVNESGIALSEMSR